MDINRTIQILEALASGCSPTTGEILHNESILNQRDVIRAFQIAIDHLKKDNASNQKNILIAPNDMQNAVKAFKDANRNPTPTNLTEFFLGTRNFKDHTIISNPLFGKFKNIYSKGKLIDFFTEYFFAGNLRQGENLKNDFYKEIDFFQKEKFNKLSDTAINQLKEKINLLGIQKTENIPEYIQTARLTHPRAYEAWSDEETELLSKAIEYTNDLDLLSQCFQRGRGSIESCGQRLIYQTQKRSQL
jgi:hypothetical protein